MTAENPETIRILLVDDHRSFMDGLAMVIDSQQPLMKVVGKSSLPEESIILAEQKKPDVILLDMDLGVANSLDILPDFLSRTNAKILIITGLDSPELHDKAIMNGARGVVLKNEPAKVILKAIEKVYEGEVWVDNRTLGRIFENINNPKNGAETEKDLVDKQKIAHLTRREKEIIRTIVTFEASTNDEIAKHLYISQSTLKNHLTAIYDKLGVKNRIQLLKFALAHNLAEPPE